MYYIYENWQAGPHKLVVHSGTCGFCNNGGGLKGGTNPRYGRWLPNVFQTSQAAKAFANVQTGIALVIIHRCAQ